MLQRFHKKTRDGWKQKHSNNTALLQPDLMEKHTPILKVADLGSEGKISVYVYLGFCDIRKPGMLGNTLIYWFKQTLPVIFTFYEI